MSTMSREVRPTADEVRCDRNISVHLWSATSIVRCVWALARISAGVDRWLAAPLSRT